jgi:hypothetical protein
MTDRQILETILEKINLIERQQSEHGEILHSLRHAGEIQKAQLDSLEIESAKLSGVVHQGFAEQKESIQSLADMYGQHELELGKLRRRSV